MNTSLRRLLLTLIGAPAAALAVWALAVPVAGTALTVRAGGGTQPVGPVSVVMASLLAGPAGWALLTVLERFSSRPGRVWTVAAPVLSVQGTYAPSEYGTHPAVGSIRCR
ncbi:hypothetical protein E1286_07320 [Nonomuraea terrae]|uniref:Uncharacterized protein n=1 Tax=Nonomuraea terrae TaxID=2530383 RepID=A0A4R4Z561_9ACTN|nr:DUF6069 family protein [Nonomuraea terrae]TDD53228.1 hypothetical protein E1286_07320 [Nonomuraea terrae]